jgi:hypothetical protein
MKTATLVFIGTLLLSACARAEGPSCNIPTEQPKAPPEKYCVMLSAESLSHTARLYNAEIATDTGLIQDLNAQIKPQLPEPPKAAKAPEPPKTSP